MTATMEEPAAGRRERPPSRPATAQEQNAEYNEKTDASAKRMKLMAQSASAAKISNVKYKQETVTIVYSLTENNADNKVVLNSKDEPHAGFIDALNALAPHVADLIFHVSGEKTYQRNNLEIKGVHFDEKGEELLAGITATLRLDNGKVTTINTPPFRCFIRNPMCRSTRMTRRRPLRRCCGKPRRSWADAGRRAICSRSWMILNKVDALWHPSKSSPTFRSIPETG